MVLAQIGDLGDGVRCEAKKEDGYGVYRDISNLYPQGLDELHLFTFKNSREQDSEETCLYQ